MTEVYSKNHADIYKWHVIKTHYYLQWLYAAIAIKINVAVWYVVPGLASSEVIHLLLLVWLVVDVHDGSDLGLCRVVEENQESVLLLGLLHINTEKLWYSNRQEDTSSVSIYSCHSVIFWCGTHSEEWVEMKASN